jgi:hypothetical protein
MSVCVKPICLSRHSRERGNPDFLLRKAQDAVTKTAWIPARAALGRNDGVRQRSLRACTSPLPQCARNTLRDKSPSTCLAGNEDKELPAEIRRWRAEPVEREETCARADERLS